MPSQHAAGKQPRPLAPSLKRPIKRLKDENVDALIASLQTHTRDAGEDIAPLLVRAERVVEAGAYSSLEGEGLAAALLSVMQEHMDVRIVELKTLRLLVALCSSVPRARALLQDACVSVVSVLNQFASDAEIALEGLRALGLLKCEAGDVAAPACVIGVLGCNVSHVGVCCVGCDCLVAMMDAREGLKVSLAKNARLFAQMLREHLPDRELALQALHVLSQLHGIEPTSMDECARAVALAVFAFPCDVPIALPAVAALTRWTATYGEPMAGLSVVGPALGLAFRCNAADKPDVVFACLQAAAALVKRDEWRAVLAHELAGEVCAAMRTFNDAVAVGVDVLVRLCPADGGDDDGDDGGDDEAATCARLVSQGVPDALLRACDVVDAPTARRSLAAFARLCRRRSVAGPQAKLDAAPAVSFLQRANDRADVLAALDALQSAALARTPAMAVAIAQRAADLPALADPLLRALGGFEVCPDCVEPLAALVIHTQALPPAVTASALACLAAIGTIDARAHAAVRNVVVHVLRTCFSHNDLVTAALELLLSLGTTGSVLGALTDSLPRALVGAVQISARTDAAISELACRVVARYATAMHASRLDDVVAQIVRPALLAHGARAAVFDSAFELVAVRGAALSVPRLLDLATCLLERVQSTTNTHAIIIAVAPHGSAGNAGFLLCAPAMVAALLRLRSRSAVGLDLVATAAACVGGDVQQKLADAGAFAYAMEFVSAGWVSTGVRSMAAAFTVVGALAEHVPAATRLVAMRALTTALETRTWSSEHLGETARAMRALHNVIKDVDAGAISATALTVLARCTQLLALEAQATQGDEATDGATCGLRVICQLSRNVAQGVDADVFRAVADRLHLALAVTKQAQRVMRPSSPAFVHDMQLISATVHWMVLVGDKRASQQGWPRP